MFDVVDWFVSCFNIQPAEMSENGEPWTFFREMFVFVTQIPRWIGTSPTFLSFLELFFWGGFFVFLFRDEEILQKQFLSSPGFTDIYSGFK